MTRNNSQSLFEKHPQNLEVPIILLLCTVLLILGLLLPVITLKELVFIKSTFSVWSGVVSLIKEGHFVLAIIIFFFSIVFPVAKLTVLAGVWFLRLAKQERDRLLNWISILGKWSMLDVFVVAITIVIAKISKLASAEPRVGIYFFGGSIILTLLIAERIDRLIKSS